MQERTEDAEARARRATELLKQSLDEIEHLRRIVELWRTRACDLERLLLEAKPTPGYINEAPELCSWRV